MNEFLLYINALIYIIFAICIYSKKKSIDEGLFTFSLYALSAVACVYSAACGLLPSFWNYSLLGFIYLFISIYIICKPTLWSKAGYIYSKLSVSLNSKAFKILEYLSILYVLFSIISIYYSASDFLAGMGGDVWLDVYQDSEKYEEVYKNPIDGLAKRYTDYFRPVILLYCFFYVTRPDAKFIRFFIMLAATIFCALAISMKTASRGNIVNVIFLVMICYLIFRKEIPRKLDKIIKIIGLSGFAVMVIFLIAVTSSRFADGAIDSVIYYMGHSMTAFNHGIFAEMEGYSQGTYIFNYFTEMLGIDYIPRRGVKLYDYEFVTIVGVLYEDFGPIFSLVFICLLSSSISRLISKRKIDFADAFLYVFYLSRVAYGITTISSNEGFLWFVTILIYVFLKFIFRLKLS